MFVNKKPNYDKLAVNLRLAGSRLKIVSRKKTEQSAKGRKEVSDYLLCGKYSRARIRVEQLIRDDMFVDSLQLMELYCENLLTKVPSLSSTEELQSDTEALVASILWAAPRLWGDVKELKAISNQLLYKYGKIFRSACVSNLFGNVSKKLVEKMEHKTPSISLVENYLEEIARTYKAPFRPLSVNLRDTDQWNAANKSRVTLRHSLPTNNFPYFSAKQLSEPPGSSRHRHSLESSPIYDVVSKVTNSECDVRQTSNIKAPTYLEHWLKNLKNR